MKSSCFLRSTTLPFLRKFVKGILHIFNRTISLNCNLVEDDVVSFRQVRQPTNTVCLGFSSVVHSVEFGNRLEEQIEIYESILKLGGGSIGIDGCVSQIAILSEKLGSTDRITELLKSAHSLKCCYEVLAPKAAAPESKASSYKSLLSACINQAFDSIYQLYQYVSTEDEFEALARAEELFSTVYGKEYFYHSASLVHLYVPVIVFYKKGDTEQVLTRLTRIVEILEYRLHAMIHQPALLNSEEYRITLICNGSISSAQTAAKSLSLWIKEDFSEKDQSNPNIVQILDRLAYIENCNDEKSDE